MASTPSPPHEPNAFKVAIICALPVEAVMVTAVFDDIWSNFPQAEGDRNIYTIGVIGNHNAVLIHLAGRGSTYATTAVTGLSATFSSIDIVFVVGVCGGSPINITTREEICLGDCIVSTALIQYDFGRRYPGRFVRKTDVEDSLGRARPEIRALLSKLQTLDTLQALQLSFGRHRQILQEKEPKAHYPGLHTDHFFDSACLHDHHGIVGKRNERADGSEVCRKDRAETGHDEAQTTQQAVLVENASDQRSPRFHFGRFGSANTVLKSGLDRDEYIKAEKIIAFEMEAAGVWEIYPTVIVKSPCDYADSHKNKEWQGYAAATAAAGLKSILEHWRFVDTSRGPDQAVQATIAGNGHSNSRDFKIPFSIENMPISKTFVNRPIEMQRLKNELLPDDRNKLRRRFVLYGLGGIGKTQLAVSFVRTHHAKFSAIFWLDGSNEDSLKRSISRMADSIPLNRISEQSRVYRMPEERDIQIVVKEVIDWLSHPDNNKWLMIFDNVDLEHNKSTPDPLSYDIEKYMPTADHGSILITTRLMRLEKLGPSQEVKKVDKKTAKDILASRYPISSDEIRSRALLERLDGHPLAIAQAGSYLCQTGMSMTKYLQLYDEQLQEVADAPLDEYSSRSAWTTWSISYNTVLDKDEYAANLLILWSFLDRGDLWYDLFEKAYSGGLSKQACVSLLGDIAVNEVSFIKAMALLRSYSLVEGSEGSRDSEGYTMHTVVHHWVYFCHGTRRLPDFGVTAMKLIAYAVPQLDTDNYAQLQQRLLTHANMCSMKIMSVQDSVIHRICNSPGLGTQITHEEIDEYLTAMNKLGRLFTDQSKLNEAEKVYKRALGGCAKERRANLILMVTTINNLGNLYTRQIRITEAEEIYKLAPQGYEEVLGSNHPLVLATLSDLGLIYASKNNFDKGEEALSRALQGKENSLGLKDMSTIAAINNLGELYRLQGKYNRAEEMFVRLLQEHREVHEAKHVSTFAILNNLGNLHRNRGRLNEAEERYAQALQGYEEVLGPEHIRTLIVVTNLGNIYADQGKHTEAEKMYKRSMKGRKNHVRSAKDAFMLGTVNNLGILYADQGKLDEAEKMYERALQGLKQGLGPKNLIVSATLNNSSILHCKQGKLSEAEKECSQALQDYEEIVGTKHVSTLTAINNLAIVYTRQGKLSEAEGMFRQVLHGYNEVLGAEHILTLSAIKNIRLLNERQGKLDKARIPIQVPQRYEETPGAELAKPNTLVSNATGHLHNLHSETKAGKIQAIREKVRLGCAKGRRACCIISRAWLRPKPHSDILELPCAEDNTNLELDTMSTGHDLPNRDKPRPRR